MLPEAGSRSNSAFISQPKPAPKPKAKPKPKPKPAAPEREFTEEECEKDNKKTEEQILALFDRDCAPRLTRRTGGVWR